MQSAMEQLVQSSVEVASFRTLGTVGESEEQGGGAVSTNLDGYVKNGEYVPLGQDNRLGNVFAWCGVVLGGGWV